MPNFWNLSKGAMVLLALCVVLILAEGVYIYYVMRGNVSSVFDTKTTCERVVDKWEDANPDLAGERQVYTGPISPIDYENTPLTQAKNFKTAINEAVAAGPNFAGKYAVAQWGCGSNCQGHAIVNVETGKIITFGPSSEAGVGISAAHNILIVNPRENFPGVAELQKANLETLLSLANLPREYYVLEGTNDDDVRLVKICTESPFEGVRF